MATSRNRTGASTEQFEEDRSNAHQNPTTQQGGSASDESIARRAYERYQARGGDHGRDQEDWFEAEREMRNNTGTSSDNAD
jgi:hypothetical protein